MKPKIYQPKECYFSIAENIYDRTALVYITPISFWDKHKRLDPKFNKKSLPPNTLSNVFSVETENPTIWRSNLIADQSHRILLHIGFVENVELNELDYDDEDDVDDEDYDDDDEELF